MFNFDFKNPDFPVQKIGNSPKYLVIFLHGYGSNGQDMAGLVPFLQPALSDAIWLCPNAPKQTPMGGFQWFPLRDISQRELDDGGEQAAPYLNAFIDAALKYYNLSPENLILGGFSQGAMMSLYTGLRLKVAPKAILAFSGALTSEQKLADEIQSKPPVFICHGNDDEVVFASYAKRAYDKLSSLNVPVENHLFDGYAHTIPPEGLKKSLDFLSEVCLEKPSKTG